MLHYAFVIFVSGSCTLSCPTGEKPDDGCNNCVPGNSNNYGNDNN